MEMIILFLLPFAASDIWMGLVGVKYGQMFIAKFFLIETQPGVSRCGLCHFYDTTNCFKIGNVATNRH